MQLHLLPYVALHHGLIADFISVKMQECVRIFFAVILGRTRLFD